jgi:hypothetical protein
MDPPNAPERFHPLGSILDRLRRLPIPTDRIVISAVILEPVPFEQ